MNVTIDLENASSSRKVPKARQFRDWSAAALAQLALDASECSLSIRLVNEAESAELNSRYRGKQGPTNILSFPLNTGPGWPDELGLPLGDLAICVPVVEKEAQEQEKAAEAHWAHLTVHGVLHLNGFDHENTRDAAEMEALEIRILAGLGYHNPYE